MRLIQAEVKTGKTSTLVAWLREDPSGRYLLVQSEREVADIRRRFDLGNEFMIIGVSQMLATPNGDFRGRVAGIDELDLVLAVLVGKVEIATRTEPKAPTVPFDPNRRLGAPSYPLDDDEIAMIRSGGNWVRQRYAPRRPLIRGDVFAWAGLEGQSVDGRRLTVHSIYLDGRLRCQIDCEDGTVQLPEIPLADFLAAVERGYYVLVYRRPWSRCSKCSEHIEQVDPNDARRRLGDGWVDKSGGTFCSVAPGMHLPL